MKVIFLDVDGVLNCYKTFDYCKYVESITGVRPLEIDEERVERLKKIVDETDAKIVLSSTWRILFKKENNEIIPIDSKGRAFQQKLLRHELEIYDMTPKDPNKIRENEINEWLSKHSEVESYVILDDQAKCLGSFVGTSLVRTYFYNCYGNHYRLGLCDFHVNQAISILNNGKSNKQLVKKL